MYSYWIGFSHLVICILWFLHVFSWLGNSFPLSVVYQSVVWQYHSPFIHSPTKRHFGYLQVLAVMKKAAINICVQVLCEHKFFTPLGKYQEAQLLDI